MRGAAAAQAKVLTTYIKKKHALNLNGCNRGSPRTVATNPDLDDLGAYVLPAPTKFWFLKYAAMPFSALAC